MLGAVVVPLNSWWTGGELAFALEDSGSKVVVADEDRINRLAESGYDLPIIAAKTAASFLHGSVPIEELTNGKPLDESEFASLAPDDP